MKEKSENCRCFSTAKNACQKIESPSPPYKLRKLSEEDIPVLQTLFRETVLHVNARDYTREEVEDWASCGDSMEHMKDLLARNDYVAALNERDEIIGFSSMNAEGYLHSLFVHKDYQRVGVGSLLLSAVEKRAREYGVSEITSEVSLTARPFFEKKRVRSSEGSETPGKSVGTDQLCDAKASQRLTQSSLSTRPQRSDLPASAARLYRASYGDGLASDSAKSGAGRYREEGDGLGKLDNLTKTPPCVGGCRPNGRCPAG